MLLVDDLGESWLLGKEDAEQSLALLTLLLKGIRAVVYQARGVREGTGTANNQSAKKSEHD
jgi:hypothetical protein